ncbi:TadE/TadG family type IV pilus assembly protein [Variovorax sp. PDC80]|uniref:TadE/TadG family type IV pilus assembly protein n=1 Tax=Variovorax sp. PDC80 TaxID=1882827 RepID=UPI000B896E66|nr:TadE/TadG family type IV pilus assembly protein [Variovorax sp. PDC80]
MSTTRHSRRASGPRAALQRGVAAIEFALVFSILFCAIYGIATFGAVLYIQQVVSRAAEDGARAIAYSFASSKFQDADRAQIKATVVSSLSSALIVPNSEIDPRQWVTDHVDIDPRVVEAGLEKTGVVTVVYRYSENRLLPSIPFFDISLWMPDKLTGQATVAL